MEKRQPWITQTLFWMAADLGYDVISGSHGQYNLGQAFSSL
jgi:hypothetical protein